jgi:hypothetical protein
MSEGHKLSFSIENKFRSGAKLDESDRDALKDAIIRSSSCHEMQSFLYIYGISFPIDNDISRKASFYIRDQRIPGLTSVCLKVLTDFWDQSQYIEDMAFFLDYDLYEDWYDEVIVSLSFFARHPRYIIPEVAGKINTLVIKAREVGDVSIHELIDSFDAQNFGDTISN